MLLSNCWRCRRYHLRLVVVVAAIVGHMLVGVAADHHYLPLTAAAVADSSLLVSGAAVYTISHWLLPHSGQDLVRANPCPITIPCPAVVGWLHLDSHVSVVSLQRLFR